VNRLNTYAASVALAGALVLTGCGSDISHGTITSKTYVPEKDWVYMQPITMPQCSGSGTSQICSSVVTGYIPIDESDPECWRLNLRDGKKTGWVCVSKAAWEKAKKGEQW
jgi:hypothetical protein